MSFLYFIAYLLLGALAFLVYWLRRRLTYWQRRGIACEEPNWLAGNAAGIGKTRSFADVWLDTYNKFRGTGPFCGFYMFQSPVAFILDPQLAKLILIKDFNNFADRGFYCNEKDDPLTGHLVHLDGYKWRSIRGKLTPTFTSGKMKFMFPSVVQVGEEFVRVFGDMVEQEAVIEVKDTLARFTTDVIGNCAFGIDCNSLKDPKTEFLVMGKESTKQNPGLITSLLTTNFPNFSRRMHIKITDDHITEFFLRIVRENAEYREKHNIKRNDFFDLLLELKNNKKMKSEDGTTMSNLTLEEIAAQAFVFLVAGFETSSTTMGFALYELALHQDMQDKARAEIVEVLTKREQEFTYECMKELQYLEQIISETLRLYTVLPILNRQALEDYRIPGHPNYVIEKGMMVIIPNGAFHRDPDFFPNPDEFNPDNFSPEKLKARDSAYYIPFGDGPRNCIGMRFGLMQTRIGLALLLKHFKFSACSKTTVPIKYDKESFLISTESGIYLKVERVSY